MALGSGMEDGYEAYHGERCVQLLGESIVLIKEGKVAEQWYHYDLLCVRLLNGILSKFGKSILNCWEKKLNVRRILENVDLPSSILELFINSKETSAIDTSKVAKVSNKDFVADKEDEFIESNDGEEQSCSQLPYHQIWSVWIICLSFDVMLSMVFLRFTVTL
ncbi:hypothetical protein Tco_0694264 [Tanacetum coccineum]